MKKFVIITLIALIHFALSVLVVWTSLLVGSAVTAENAEPSLAFKALVLSTKILHYPIITQALYSRHWFPGGWIYFPIFINSLLWAAGIIFLYYIYKKLKNKKANGNRKH